jgi:hypothetical protein
VTRRELFVQMHERTPGGDREAVVRIGDKLHPIVAVKDEGPRLVIVADTTKRRTS